MRPYYNLFGLVALTVFPFLILSGCGNRGSADRDKVIAYVNKEPIYASELKRSIALKTRQDPMFKVTPETRNDHLDMLIERKLIIQEAIDKGLASEDKFVNTIKTFWEQTLIRDFIDSKKREFEESLTVTNDDVRKYYNNLGQRVTFKVLKSKDRRYIDDAYANIIKNNEPGTISWDTIGPIGYEDINSNILFESFDVPVGGVRKIEERPNYYLVLVANKEEVTLKPMETLRPEIEKRVVMMKERRLFEDWRKRQRGEAQIEILEK